MLHGVRSGAREQGEQEGGVMEGIPGKPTELCGVWEAVMQRKAY